MGTSNSRSRYGIAPMWSSWPCVSTTASSLSAFCRRNSKSGRTRSMPGSSARGNDRPQSRTRMRPSSSRQAMFRPISPTPPRKTRRAEEPCLIPSSTGSDVGCRSWLEKVRLLEDLADALALVLGRRNQREPGRPRRPAHQLERGLYRDRVARDEQHAVQSRKLVVALAPGHDVARLDELDQLADLRAHEVRGHRDDAGGAEADLAERGPVVAPVDVEVRGRLPQEPGQPVEVAGRVLHAHDVREGGELQDGLVLDADPDAAGDVVEQDREVRGLGDGGVMGDQAALRRLAVVRRDDQRAVAPRRLGQPSELDGLLRRVRARPADDLALARRRLHHGAEQVALLLVGEGRCLAGGAGRHDGVGAVLQQPARELLRAVEVERVVVAERRDHRREDGSEPTGHLGSPCAAGSVQDSRYPEAPCRRSTRSAGTTGPRGSCTGGGSRSRTRPRRPTGRWTRPWPSSGWPGPRPRASWPGTCCGSSATCSWWAPTWPRTPTTGGSSSPRSPWSRRGWWTGSRG